jgi:hypothetical protein
LFALLSSARLKPYRALGWCYLVCYTVFFVLHGKNYYLAPIYPMLVAAGAVVIESPIDGRRNAGPEIEGRENARPRRISPSIATRVYERQYGNRVDLAGMMTEVELSPYD